MSFAGSIFGGSSPELNTLIGQFGKTGSNAIGQGQKYTNQAGDFWSSIISGDASKQAQALAPEISADKKATQQDTKTSAILGGRTGGTAAHNAASSDRVHSDITNLIGSLTGSSASSLAGLGSNLLSTGLGALGQEQGAVQQRMQNWQNSILGKGITGAAQAGESFATGGVGGAAAGGSFLQGGASGLSNGSPFFGG